MSKRRPHYYSLESFVTYMKQYKWRFVLVVLCFVVSNLLLAVVPVFIGKLVGALAANPMQGHEAVIYVWVLIGLSTGHNLTWRVSEFMYLKLLFPLSFRYENMLFEQVVRKPYPYFVGKFTGKLSSYVTTISTEFRELLENVCWNYISQVIGIVAVGIILTSINWQTGAIFAVGIVGMLLVGRHTVRNSIKYEKFSTDAQSTKNGKIIDAIANFVNIKSFQKEGREINMIHVEQDVNLQAAKKSFVWSVVFWASMSFFIRDLIWPLAIGYNVYLYMHGEISIAALTTLLSTILLFSSTIWEIIWNVSQFTLKAARIEEAHLYLFGKTNLMDERAKRIASSEPVRPFTQALTLQNLNFAYPDKPDTPVLEGISLQLRKGEKIGIVGHSGSGKSTLTKLLLGYYPASGDEITLDGQLIETAELARLISYVPQDTSLFHRTVAENIAYATDLDVTKDDIVRAAKQAHAHEFIAKIDGEYDALVGERGVKLSAGQRQRIAIARAFLDDKPLLILDEATSALDSESEVLVQSALEALWDDKTVIAIAHRLSTLRNMDRIIVMHDGHIVEEGSHKDLIARKNGVYAKLWTHQSGGFIEE